MATSDPGQANRLVGLGIGALAPDRGLADPRSVPARARQREPRADPGARRRGRRDRRRPRRRARSPRSMATLSFDFFLTAPYLSLDIETQRRHRDRADPARRRPPRRRGGEPRPTIASAGASAPPTAIARVHRVADDDRAGRTPSTTSSRSVTRELRALLSLHDCWLEFRPFVYVMPRLERGGTIEPGRAPLVRGRDRALRGRRRAAGARAGRRRSPASS